MSTRSNTRNTTRRNTSSKNADRSNRSNNSTKRVVFNPSEHDGVYTSNRRLKRIGMSIRREDTRHGGESKVSVYRRAGRDRAGYRFDLTLAEARSLLSFLDRELEVRAR